MPGERPSKSEAMEPVRVEMAPTLIAVAVTPGELPEPPVVAVVDDGAVLELALVVVVVLDEDEQAAAMTATPSTTAAGHTQFPRCFPMSTFPL